MTAFTLRRCCLPPAAGLLSLFLVSCGSTKPPKSGYSDVVDYTTPTTNLSQEEYPFDKEGNYLADVVSGKKKGKPASSSYSSYSKPDPAPNPYLETYEKPVITAVDTPPEKPNPIYDRVPEPDTPPSSSSSGSSSGNSSSSSRSKTTASSTSSKAKPKSTGTASASTKSKSGSGSKTASSSKSKAAAAKPKGLSYASYKVKSKDTLYSLAGRYNTTVSAIKKANGMSSNTLVNGRTIRIPRQ